jgi:hypothetical protein
MKPICRQSWIKAAAAALLAATMTFGGGTAAWAADEEEDEAFDTKIIRQFLHGLGLRRDGAGIDYRERSPLVVPPSRDLPAPETGSVAEKTAAWPNDPDVKRAKELKAARKKPRKDIESEESRPELPSQLGPRHATTPPWQLPTGDTKDPTVPSTAAELKSKSIFNLGGLMGSKQESATFTREPPRTSLIEPPPGYRTPSPTQPYGIGPAKIEATNPMDTPQMRGMEK